jgi:sulfofructose kinase
MTRILCLGMSALDAIYRVTAIPTAPVKILASGFSESGGGMAANAVSRWRVWAATPTGAIGCRRARRPDRAALAAEGAVDDVRRIAGCTSPSAAILVAADGERLICAYNDGVRPRRSLVAGGAGGVVRGNPGGCPLLRGGRGARGRARIAGRPAVLDADIGPPTP